MTKELTPLETFRKMQEVYVFFDTDVKTIETALKENTELRKENFEMDCRIGELENELQANEKKLKTFEIIKKFIHLEFEYDNLQTPNFIISASGKKYIEEEVFDLLKEVLK